MSQKSKIGNILITEKEIEKAVKSLAEKINSDYNDEEIVLVGILKGSFIFMADLIRNLKSDTEVCFMEVSSYGSGTESSGIINIKKDINRDIADKNVLIIEDIIDSGYTLAALVKHFKERSPKSIKICTLLNKPSRRKVEINVDYTGFSIEDRFIVGYGLDYNERYRELPYIAEVELLND